MDILTDSLFETYVNCSFYLTESFNTMYNDISNQSNLFIVHHNIRSFNKNFDEFACFMASLACEIDILILSETWFSHDDVTNIVGYHSFHCTRDNKGGGGVSVYIRKTINCKAEPILVKSCDVADILCIEMQMPKEKVYLIGMYRPPDYQNPDSITSEIENVFNSIDMRCKTVVAGDMNIDLLDESNNITKELRDFMQLQSFVSSISIPTRVTDNSAKVIDHFWCNFEHIEEAGCFVNNISDHYPIFIFLPYANNSNLISKRFRDHSRSNLDKLKHEVIDYVSDFQLLNNIDIDIKTDIFLCKLSELYNTCCPIRNKLISYNRFCKPWLNEYFLNIVNRKHKLYRDYISGRVSYGVVRNFNRFVQAEKRRIKSEFFERKFSNSYSDSSSTWKTIRLLAGNKEKYDSNISLNIEGSRSSNPDQIVNAFNQYFTSIADNIANDIPVSNVSPLVYMGDRIADSFFALPATESEVSKLIASFPNKYCNINCVPIFIFKYLNDIISPVICSLFNESIECGIFPKCLKKGRVIPLYKSGNSLELNNYRPITTLLFLSKVIEKLMCRRMISFIDKHDILVSCQYGFRTGRNTSDAVLAYVDQIQECLNDGQYMISCFLDFRKAFDCVDLSILMDKLEHIGFRGHCVSWFRSYLFSRTQYVSLGGSDSRELQVTRGVPQGSNIGPLLFLIYINDMLRSAPSLTFTHFADDTCVSCRGPDIDTLQESMSLGLGQVSTWLDANKLALNINKSACMVYTNRDIPANIVISCKDNRIQMTDNYKFLGVFIDSKLKFSIHIDHVCKKVSRAAGVLRRIHKIIPHNILKMLYFSMVYPYLIYAIVVYASTYQVHLKRLENIHRSIAKLLPFNVDPYFENKLFNFDEIYKYFCLVKFFEYTKNPDSYFFNSINALIPSHNYSSRSKLNFCLNTPNLRLTTCQHSFIYRSVKFWNELPVCIKDIENLNNFKRTIKAYILSE